MSQGKFSTASDVWSYGIVCVEIFQDALTPYLGMSNPAVMQHVATGGVHPRPPNCSEASYGVLLKCWAMAPASRPQFGELRALFDDLHVAELASAHSTAMSRMADRDRKGSSFGLDNAAYEAFPVQPAHGDASDGDGYFQLSDGVMVVDDAAMDVARRVTDQQTLTRQASLASLGSLVSSTGAGGRGSLRVVGGGSSSAGKPAAAEYMVPGAEPASLYELAAGTTPPAVAPRAGRGHGNIAETALDSSEDEEFEGFGNLMEGSGDEGEGGGSVGAAADAAGQKF